MTHIPPIRPELLAAKFEKIENFEQPRLLDEFTERPELRRLLCYLQHVSQPRNYPGGLAKFAADLIAASAEFIGTTRMSKGGRDGDRYKLCDAIAIVRELTDRVREEIFGSNTDLVELVAGLGYSERYCVDFVTGSSRYEEQPTLAKSDREFLRRHIVEVLTPERAVEACAAVAREELATYLKELCELPHIGFFPADDARHRDDPWHFEHGAPWYFTRIADALLAFTEKRAAEERCQMAETAVTKLIDTWIAKSRRMGTTVMIVGNSRFGKTERIKMEAAIHPGHCRIVQTPRGNALSDLLRKVAESLGIEVGPQTNARVLTEKIDYTLRFLKLQLLVDEAQMLLPSNYSRFTEPARLNWFRRTIMDQGLPAVLVCTPQSYEPAKDRFVKRTGFAIEQFDERIDKTVKLPTELDEADLLAVARIHFPNLSDDYLENVVNDTIAPERNYLSDIAKIARYANDYARENGRERPILADIDAAIAEALPVMAPAPETTSRTPVRARRKTRVQSVCKPYAEALPRPRTTFETPPENDRRSLRLADMTT